MKMTIDVISTSLEFNLSNLFNFSDWKSFNDCNDWPGTKRMIDEYGLEGSKLSIIKVQKTVDGAQLRKEIFSAKLNQLLAKSELSRISGVSKVPPVTEANILDTGKTKELKKVLMEYGLSFLIKL